MRKMMFLAATCASKSSCLALQVLALPVESTRPLITNKACTPPSGEPSGFFTKRASRTGPFALIKAGTVSVPPSLLANATWGLTDGLDPPAAGWIWQPPQLSRFILGPRPSGTSSGALKSSLPWLKNASWFAVNPDSGLPEAAAPPRTPGSWAAKPEGLGVGLGLVVVEGLFWNPPGLKRRKPNEDARSI